MKSFFVLHVETFDIFYDDMPLVDIKPDAITCTHNWNKNKINIETTRIANISNSTGVAKAKWRCFISDMALNQAYFNIDIQSNQISARVLRVRFIRMERDSGSHKREPEYSYKESKEKFSEMNIKKELSPSVPSLYPLQSLQERNPRRLYIKPLIKKLSLLSVSWKVKIWAVMLAMFHPQETKYFIVVLPHQLFMEILSQIFFSFLFLFWINYT